MKKFGNLFKLTKPKFWQKRGLLNLLLLPLSIVYLIIFYIKKFLIKPYHSKLKIITIGNIVIGGSGKTPLAIKIFNLLKNQGCKPCFLTRGYLGEIKGPHLVSLNNNPKEVGDEALLLAEIGSVIVSRDRALGAKYIENLNKFDVIIMDDGLQHFSLKQDCKLLVIDGEYEFGNNLVLPAGPLRELPYLTNNIDAAINIGGKANKIYHHNNFQANFVLTTKLDITKSWTAFAGIGNPEKFFKFLKNNNFNLKEVISYPDHYNYPINEQLKLKNKIALITTKKDWIKLSDDLKKIVEYVDIDLNIENEKQLLNLILEKIKK